MDRLDRGNGRRRWLIAGAVVLVALLVVLGWLVASYWSVAGTPRHSAPAPSAVAVHSSTEPVPSTPLSLPRSVPVSVDIPALSTHSSLVPLGLNSDGTVQVPPVSTPMQAGWYNLGPTPGEIGPAVILGHVDGDHQLGVFYRLHDMKPGDQVFVARQDGSTARFTVTKVQEIVKSQFPRSLVYGQTGDAELRLITCGGAFDGAARSYVDNIIVYAVLDAG